MEQETIILGLASPTSFDNATTLARKVLEVKDKQFRQANLALIKNGQRTLHCFNCWKQEKKVNKATDKLADYQTLIFDNKQPERHTFERKIKGGTEVEEDYSIGFVCERVDRHKTAFFIHNEKPHINYKGE